MRVCPSCGNSYPDDANFCPMDATRLPPPVAEAPATIPSMPVASPAVTQPDQPAPVGGRFVLSGVAMQTPTGLAQSATDTQTGATVVVKMVAAEVLPTTAMADRALRELKQLGKVTSERIVRVIDQGGSPTGASTSPPRRSAARSRSRSWSGAKGRCRSSARAPSCCRSARR